MKLIILIALGMCLLPVKAYCELKILPPDQPAVQPVAPHKVTEITGEVSQIDSVGGVVVVQTVNELGVPVEVKFYDSNNGKDIRGNAHLIDVNVSDWITVRYTVDSSGNNIITKLTDNNISNNPI
jgi:hypothetical protein